MTPIQITESAQGVLVGVKVVPSSSKTQIAGLLNGMIKVRVSSAPEKGKANRCLTDFLAKKLSAGILEISISWNLSSQMKSLV